MATKETLQLFCKSLGISATGTKEILKARICAELCDGDKYVTFRYLLRKKNDRAFLIINDIKEMIEDDSSVSSIVKSLGKLHRVKLEKIDIEVFADILDAHSKKDYGYIEEKLDQWNAKEVKYGVIMARIYAEHEQLKKLLEVL